MPLSEDEEHKLITSGKPYAWRLSLAACEQYFGARYGSLRFTNNDQETHADPARLGDVILARKDVGTSYHLACCHDDALQNITHIVRGVDLLDSTHVHRVLQEIMGRPVPKYIHHSLLLDKRGKKFSKRDKSQTLRELRLNGHTAQNLLAQAQGLG